MRMSDFLKRLGVILFFIVAIAIAWEGLAPVMESSKLTGQAGSLEAYCYVYGSGCAELQTQDQLNNCCTPLYSTENECSDNSSAFLQDVQIASTCCAQSCNGVQKCMDECMCELSGDCANKPAFSLTFDLTSIPVAISGNADDFLTLNISEEIPVEFTNFAEELAKTLQGNTGSLILKGRGVVPLSFAGLGDVHSYLVGTGAHTYSVKGVSTAPMSLSSHEGNVSLISTVVLPLEIMGEQEGLPAEATAVLSIGGIDGLLLPTQFPFPINGSGSVKVTVANDTPTSMAIAISGELELSVEAPEVQLGEPEEIVTGQSSIERMEIEVASVVSTAVAISSAPIADVPAPVPAVVPEPVVISSLQSSAVQSSSTPIFVPEIETSLPLGQLVPMEPVPTPVPTETTRPPRPVIARTPLQQTGPAALLMIAIGSAAGVGFVRRKK